MLDVAWSQRRSGKGRHPDDSRTPDEVDFARVVHSGAFRRLQGKTQILSLGDDDFYRTRLTHSLEVAQICEGILQHLRSHQSVQDILPPSPLLRAVGLAHDIGHPPFGHGGEVALNYCLREAGGFEGNAQTLRLMARLESYASGFGADLTRRTLLGLLKYPALQSKVANPKILPKLVEGATTIAIVDDKDSTPAKACYDCDAEIVDWILDPLSQEDRDRFLEVVLRPGKHGKTEHKSLDCSIMDAADDIAYGVHDFEDALALQLIENWHFREWVGVAECEPLVASLQKRAIDGVEPTYDGVIAGLFGTDAARKRLIGRLVHLCISATDIVRDDGFQSPLLANTLVMNEPVKSLLGKLRDLINAIVIKGPRVQHLDFKGQRLVVSCFEALTSDPKRLAPELTYREFEACGGDIRILGDHLGSLTDAGLLRLYDRLFSPRMGTVFDRV